MGMYFAHLRFTYHGLFLLSFLQHKDFVVLSCFGHVYAVLFWACISPTCDSHTMSCFRHRFDNTLILLFWVVLCTSKNCCFGHAFRPLWIHTSFLFWASFYITTIVLFWARLRGVVLSMYFAHL